VDFASLARFIAAHLSFHLLLYTAIILLLLYKPPARVIDHLRGIGDFISRHWGDSIGLYMIHLGIVLIILGGLFTQLSDVAHVGESFILTGVGMLKLRYNPPNGKVLPDGSSDEAPTIPPTETGIPLPAQPLQRTDLGGIQDRSVR
jgi:hypothetical protein